MIAFENVSKVFPGGVKAVRELSFEVEENETVVLLGTSGSGKTTTMKMVNRLLEPTDGRILIAGKDVMNMDVIELRRQIGYAIQHIGLFPHMTVGDNVGVVPNLLNWKSDETAGRVDKLLDMVGLDPDDFRDRYVHQLSGGQQQRVGVARALGADPPIVLMDEPFGALDPITREQLQNEFLELESEIQKTILFVTHDVFEAVKMGDRIALMDAGQLQQLATPQELVDNPANQFVDDFLGTHRFQLSLLTHQIQSIMPEPPETSEPEERPEFYLTARTPLIEALDLFKKYRRKEAPVYRGEEFIGNLKKQSLIDSMASALEETGTQ
ncbi:MAG: ATP-binding cassette domain-containing protein [Pirellulaceae bacterium]